MSDIIYKIIPANEYHEGCATVSVSQTGFTIVSHELVLTSGYYSGVVQKLTDRFDDPPLISGV